MSTTSITPDEQDHLYELATMWIVVTRRLVKHLEAMPATGNLDEAGRATRQVIFNLMKPQLTHGLDLIHRRLSRVPASLAVKQQRVQRNYDVKNRVLLEARYAINQLMLGAGAYQAAYVLDQINAAIRVETLDEAQAERLAIGVSATR
jgi:hypothetical protein